MRIFILISVITMIGCGTAAQTYKQEKPQRALFKRSDVEIKAPKEYLMRETEKGEYDPKPRIVTVDEKAGKYEFRWIGYDGKEKIIVYQMSDAIDAYAEVSIEKTDNGLVYKYLVRNLKSSPTYVGAFIVQTFSADVRNERVPAGDDLHIGHMTRMIHRFSNGLWRTFAPLEEKNHLIPGSEREFTINSTAQPGVVGCAARGGSPTIKGVGEHMPSELENAMPGYEEFASCITIGPDERLAKFTRDEKIKYLLDNLPKFVEAGWMAGDTSKIYQDLLKEKDLSRVSAQVENDVKNGYVTNEVFYVIEGLAN